MSATSPDELCQAAQTCLDQGRAAEALPLFLKAIQQDADHAAAHEGVALASSLASDWDTAEKHFAKLIQLQPMEARHYINLGTLYNRKGDFQRAVDTLRRALQRDRKNAHGYFNLGLAYRKLKQTAMSVSAYKEAIKINPEFAEAYMNLANVLVDMGSLQQAVQMFKKALILRPNLEKAKRGLEKAEAAFRQAKNAESPFGRLVGTDTRARSMAAQDRELSEDERERDRLAIRTLMGELDQLTRDCADHLERAMERRLHDLHVLITSNELSTALNHSSLEFRAALQRWQGLRQQLRRKVQELRAHEELMNAPQIDAT
jgi:tetratricopeptide (TPR) repeat protein